LYIIFWEYQVRSEKQSEFEKIYSSDGAWAELFNRDTSYLGTELLRDEARPWRFLTIDRWTSKEEYEAFLSRWKKEYETLDAQCEGLTENESLIGKWDSS
jgi:quinol monooxygenase YgiN